jgi:hypothetical protein
VLWLSATSYQGNFTVVDGNEYSNILTNCVYLPILYNFFDVHLNFSVNVNASAMSYIISGFCLHLYFLSTYFHTWPSLVYVFVVETVLTLYKMCQHASGDVQVSSEAFLI